MEKENLSLDQVVKSIEYISKNMIASKDLLTQADKNIGDGDHGIGMARGFEAVLTMLNEKEFSDIHEVFQSTGITLLSSIGGAAGAVFGSFFMGASEPMKGNKELDAELYALALQSSLDKVKQRGKAQIGDKTMVDALEPAANAANTYTGKSLKELARLVHKTANEGMEKTKTFAAKIGKAKTMGDRTIGFADPGAISITLIFQYFYEFIDNQE